MSDLIDRQAAIEALGERPMVWIGSDYEVGSRNQYDADVLALETVPSAQPERKKGQWRNIQIGEWLGVECTACKIAYDRREVPHVNGGGVAWYFCPECGADMRGEGNGNE